MRSHVTLWKRGFELSARASDCSLSLWERKCRRRRRRRYRIILLLFELEMTNVSFVIQPSRRCWCDPSQFVIFGGDIFQHLVIEKDLIRVVHQRLNNGFNKIAVKKFFNHFLGWWRGRISLSFFVSDPFCARMRT